MRRCILFRHQQWVVVLIVSLVDHRQWAVHEIRHFLLTIWRLEVDFLRHGGCLVKHLLESLILVSQKLVLNFLVSYVIVVLLPFLLQGGRQIICLHEARRGLHICFLVFCRVVCLISTVKVIALDNLSIARHWESLKGVLCYEAVVPRPIRETMAFGHARLLKSNVIW
jgi:hypothetical protein